MKKIAVEEAVGHVLAHDITEIKPGKRKGPAFKKGDVIKEEDISKLKDLGKRHIYIWDKKPGYLHENEAAARLAALAQGTGIKKSPPSEGKINLRAAREGLLKVDQERLVQLNQIEQVMMATRHNNTPIKEGEQVAGTRVIPLIIPEEKIVEVEEKIGSTPILEIKEYKDKKAVIITTGSEVFAGRITDKFTPIVKEKLTRNGLEVLYSQLVPDDRGKIAAEIEKAISQGADMVVCTGGMSVDPDDLTPAAIRETADRVITYGAPVLPGAMFMLAYSEEIPLVGLPGCAMFSKTTVFDLILPRLAGEEEISKREIAELGHGGLCLGCEACSYPACSFGKGW